MKVAQMSQCLIVWLVVLVKGPESVPVVVERGGERVNVFALRCLQSAENRSVESETLSDPLHM